MLFGHVEADEIDAPIASVTDSGYNRTGTGNSVVADTQEFVMVTHEKPGGVVEDVAILKSNFSANLEQLKKEYPGFTATSLQSVGENKYKKPVLSRTLADYIGNPRNV